MRALGPEQVWQMETIKEAVRLESRGEDAEGCREVRRDRSRRALGATVRR